MPMVAGCHAERRTLEATGIGPSPAAEPCRAVAGPAVRLGHLYLGQLRKSSIGKASVHCLNK